MPFPSSVRISKDVLCLMSTVQFYISLNILMSFQSKNCADVRGAPNGDEDVESLRSIGPFPDVNT